MQQPVSVDCTTCSFTLTKKKNDMALWGKAIAVVFGGVGNLVAPNSGFAMFGL